MKHILEDTVYYGDTDAYGVVWHGTYLRWMEKARVEFCRDLGLDLKSMMENDIVTPVTNINLRYKSSAKLDDRIIIETSVTKMTPLTMVFTQIIKSKETMKTYIQAEVEVVAVNGEGKIYRRLPDVLKLAGERAMQE